jgi:PAS domain S-box-containing protein
MSEGRVLVVDDQADYRNLMKAHLNRRGFEVEVAINGVEAMRIIKEQEPFEVLVADLMMPEMDGLELLRRAREHDSDLQVVVISGVGTLESAISSMRMGGAYDYLPKPLDSITDLSLAVERAAQHRRLMIERERLQAQVATERARLQAVIENTRDGLISADSKGEITLANPSAEAMFGESSLVGKQVFETLPATISALISNWLRFMPERPAATEVNWPDGRIHLISLTPVAEESREGSGWVMLLRDVTDVRQLQRLKMQLLAQAAGGLREPLADAVEALITLNEAADEADERFTEAAQRGMDDMARIRGWMDEVLTLVEFEAGPSLDESRMSLVKAVETMETTTTLEPLEAKEIKLEYQLKGETLLSLQEGPLAKLLEHLVRQAAWRSPRKGLIKLSVEVDEKQVWLKVEDDGPALLEDEAPQLFDGLVAQLGEDFEGLGLSLAMIKSAADALNGQLWVWSGMKKGNTFAVSFPSESTEGG